MFCGVLTLVYCVFITFSASNRTPPLFPHSDSPETHQQLSIKRPFVVIYVASIMYQFSTTLSTYTLILLQKQTQY